MTKRKTLKDDLLEGGVKGRFYEFKSQPHQGVYRVVDLFGEVHVYLERENYFPNGKRAHAQDNIEQLTFHLNDPRAPRGFKPKE